jgi:hypothetical protein
MFAEKSTSMLLIGSTILRGAKKKMKKYLEFVPTNTIMVIILS